MGFVYERVAKEDWELYNSFEIIDKTGDNVGQKDFANESSSWYVDRDREAYFILTGVLGREQVEYYTLVINGKKVNIVACLERRFEENMKTGYRIYSIIADIGLLGQSEEFRTMIKEVLQLGWKNGLDFIEFSVPKYRTNIK